MSRRTPAPADAPRRDRQQADLADREDRRRDAEQGGNDDVRERDVVAAEHRDRDAAEADAAARRRPRCRGSRASAAARPCRRATAARRDCRDSRRPAAAGRCGRACGRRRSPASAVRSRPIARAAAAAWASSRRLLAPAADEMLDAEVIGHLPQVDGGDRARPRRRSRTRRGSSDSVGTIAGERAAMAAVSALVARRGRGVPMG